ncbi:MAG TPA: hypothetical protein VLV47_00650 [Candidatus Bathyarchaeia archaeon]|nr:hypothetical protein [Candidatus Bathyarchaeia archaeon]
MILRFRNLGRWLAAAAILAACCLPAAAQSKSESSQEPASVLEQKFFSALRTGDSNAILSYIPAGGVNVGANAQHVSREEIERQLQFHHGIYCQLFDSSCIDAPIQLDNVQRACSYRELLTHSENVHTAASELTRNGVQQAVLVARIENKQCPSDKLIDFIFNLHAEGWKLFSIP